MLTNKEIEEKRKELSTQYEGDQRGYLNQDARLLIMNDRLDDVTDQHWEAMLSISRELKQAVIKSNQGAQF